ncbi:MAG TPA: hypothetical protein VFI82_01185 [Terriglobales bacterium]|jgi:fatty acid desaturase|nr:hypothetical protein [Terriglobales bacterium]
MATGGAGQESELAKAAREALGRAALAAVALVVAVLIPAPMWARILIFFTILFVAGMIIRVRKAHHAANPKTR